jgi:hypothetical protein
LFWYTEVCILDLDLNLSEVEVRYNPSLEHKQMTSDSQLFSAVNIDDQTHSLIFRGSIINENANERTRRMFIRRMSMEVAVASPAV